MAETTMADPMVGFVHMSDSTRQDYDLADAAIATYREGFACRILALFSRMRGVNLAHPVDMCAFDPDYDSLPLSAFEPMVRWVFAREPRTFT